MEPESEFVTSELAEITNYDCSNIKQKRPLDDCDESIDPKPKKKLCRYYFLDSCKKAETCSFMHSEFPCKFYYFGFECKDGKNCKLRHGPALDEHMQEVLWNHVTSAPANLLQRFPCFPYNLLKRNFHDRHNELIMIEQEGLLEEHKPTVLVQTEDSSSSFSNLSGSVSTELQELVKILEPEKITLLNGIGVHTLKQLFELDIGSLQEIGFDTDALNKIEKFKEDNRPTSIYTSDGNKTDSITMEIEPETLHSVCIDDAFIPAAVDQPALTDQELLSILNDDLNSVQIAKVSSQIDFHNPFTENEASLEDTQNDECSLKAFRSDAGSEIFQLMFNPSIKEKENDKKLEVSVQRTVEQLKKIDSLLSEPKEQDVSWGTAESDTSGDIPNHDSSTESVNQSFGSDSDSHTCFRMPFKSIINQYTPAMEIDATKGFPIKYKLIPIDIPRPNFDRIRRSFIAQPTYSSDPRIQIMFNIVPKEVPQTGHPKVCDRDPRLKKQIDLKADPKLV